MISFNVIFYKFGLLVRYSFSKKRVWVYLKDKEASIQQNYNYFQIHLHSPRSPYCKLMKKWFYYVFKYDGCYTHKIDLIFFNISWGDDFMEEEASNVYIENE